MIDLTLKDVSCFDDSNCYLPAWTVFGCDYCHLCVVWYHHLLCCLGCFHMGFCFWNWKALRQSAIFPYCYTSQAAVLDLQKRMDSCQWLTIQSCSFCRLSLKLWATHRVQSWCVHWKSKTFVGTRSRKWKAITLKLSLSHPTGTC